MLDDCAKVFYSFGEPVNDGFFLALRRTLDIVDKDIQEHLLVSRHEGVEGTQVIHFDKCTSPYAPLRNTTVRCDRNSHAFSNG